MIEEKQCSKVYEPADMDRWDKASYERSKKYINDIEAFGWYFLREDSKPGGRGGRYNYTFLVYGRDTNMAHYDELKELEEEYNEIRKDIDLWDMEWEIFGILLLTLIIPGIIYLIYTLKKRNTIWNTNMRCDEEMDEVVQRAKRIMNK